MAAVFGFEQLAHRSNCNLFGAKIHGRQTVTQPPHLFVEVRSNSTESSLDGAGLVVREDIAMTEEARWLCRAELIFSRSTRQPIESPMNKNVVAAHSTHRDRG